MIDLSRTSPDGLLRLIVRRTGDDLTLGFEGFAWHTHGDILAAAASPTPDQASERLAAAIVTNEAVIGLSVSSGEVRDVWITEDPAGDLKHSGASETIEFRLWNGSLVDPANLSSSTSAELS